MVYIECSVLNIIIKDIKYIVCMKRIVEFNSFIIFCEFLESFIKGDYFIIEYYLFFLNLD